ncbi:MAG TPA: THUMP domain-containing protein, partial [Longimicrobiales bacterium]|nr:THUMP domain-containing protein [Longimicrobiales bacterium]
MTGNRERGTGSRVTRPSVAAPEESRDPPFPVPGSLFPCFATTAPGLEGLLAHELTALGIQPYDQEPGGITFEADQRQLYAANLHLRTAGRVLVRITAFKAAHFAELEKAAARVEWTRWVSPGTAVHFRITSRKSRLYHQKAIADRLEAAVLRTVPDALMVRKADEADAQEHVQQFIVRLAYDQCVISADSSGALLHQRGYRQAVAKAPLRETLAAAMLLGAGASPLDGQSTRFLRQPSVSATQIAFVHADDIWIVARQGGEARRLTSAQGSETDPAFSPDGRWVAFTGEYDGNEDVYLVEAEGGQPVRLTWHPGSDVVQGWTPEGEILFRSGRDGVPTRLWAFYTVPPSGGFP